MPRQSRIDAPGALHHIVLRGIERKAIFKDDLDYQNFLNRLGKVLIETSTSCYAWVLMTNHVHLLLRTGTAPISTVMRRLLTGYAQQFNRRYRRHGHLFQNRYKSYLCEEDPYLLELVRYIHLNPLRAGIVKDLRGLSKYWKCGHSVLMGKRKNEWQDTDYILALFDKKIVSARRSYSDFVKKGITQGSRPDLVGGGLLRSAGGWSALTSMRSVGLRIMGDERILGSGDFVENVLKQANEEYEKKTLAKAKGLDLDTLIDAVAKYFDIASKILKGSSKQRTVSRARSIICYLAINKMGISGAAIARKLMLSPSTVSKSSARGQTDSLTKQIENEIFDYSQ
jgi:putative transposase